MTAPASNPTRVERTADREIIVTRTFNGPPHVVFEAWCNMDLFRRWWVPPSFGITLVACEADVRTGGSYRFTFSHPAAPEPMVFFGRYLEVTPYTRIVWTNEESSDAPVTTVTFEDRDGQTRLTMREEYPTKESLDEALANGSSGTAAAPEQFSLLDEVLKDAA